jgi:RHS repeat-associated protein
VGTETGNSTSGEPGYPGSPCAGIGPRPLGRLAIYGYDETLPSRHAYDRHADLSTSPARDGGCLARLPCPNSLETGLDYFGARYYSGAQGRFTSPDEFPGGIVDPVTGLQVGQPGPLPYADITDPQTLNKYAYVRNNPLRYTDPNGHCGPWCAAIGAAGGATAQVLADWATGKPITLRKTFAAAVGGAIIGGTAGAASELGLAVQVAIVGDAGVVAGITERSITSGSINEAMGSPGEMAGDFVSNAAGHGLVRAAEGVVTRVSGGAVENLSDQLPRARTPNRQAKIQDRLDAATERLENKKAAASAVVDTTRETRSRIQQKGCRQGEPGCGENK